MADYLSLARAVKRRAAARQRYHLGVPETRIVETLARRGFAVGALRPVAGDLSERRYLRAELDSGGSAIVALYPDSLRGDCAAFLASSELLASAGVRVPRLLASDCAAGWTLLEDLGEHTVADLPGLSPGSLAAYLWRAAETLALIQSLPLDRIVALNPPLDRSLLRNELEQTRREFLEPLGLLGEEAAAWQRAADRLCEAIGQAGPVPCHRDFMVRNLMPVGEAPSLAVIDHQGLRPGPPWYDLASLLNDTLFLPPAAEEDLLREYLQNDRQRLDFRRAAAQRTLKAVGTYARFVRRGESRHAPLIAPTFGRALDHLAELPETAGLARALTARWQPIEGRESAMLARGDGPCPSDSKSS